jgi:chromosome segregation ATPase
MSEIVANAGPTEAEMNHIRGIFSRAADAIVSASELKQRVTHLEHDMDVMRRELETVKNTNNWLTEQLGQVRGQRDKLQQEVDHANANISTLNKELDAAKETITDQSTRIGELTDKLHAAQKESDDHLLRAMTAEEELAKIRQKLDEAFSWMHEAQRLFEKPKEEPKEVAPIVPFPDTGTAGSEAVGDSGEPTEPVEQRTVVGGERDPYRW